MSHLRVSRGRLILIAGGVMAAFGVVLARLAFLHVVDGPDLAAQAAQSREATEVIPAQRGSVYDARGNLLAATRPVITVGVDPESLQPGDEAIIPEVARLLNLTATDVEAAFARRPLPPRTDYPQEIRYARWVELAEGVDEETYAALRALGVKALYGNRIFERHYPAGSAAAHVLGFVNKEGTPVMGVEQYLDFYLRGQNGLRETERDGRRHERPEFRRLEVTPVAGLDAELTLDLVVQTMLEREADRLMEEFTPESVTIIVSEPQTGSILGLVNRPTFDPNHFWDFSLDDLRNRAVTDVFEPGSTFKIVAAGGALNEHLVDPSTLIDCAAPIVEYRGRKLRLPSDYKQMETLPVLRVVSKSSNRGAAHMGLMLGEDRLYGYARAFGFGERTGWGPGGEVNGILAPVKRWDGLTITRLPMGHAIAATPLQVHQAMSVVANDGILVRPRLVRSIREDSGQHVLTFLPRTERRVISSRVAYELSVMLSEGVSTEGTAPQAVVEGYQVAGKTGTTQKIIDGQYSREEHVASFSGFFPASRPQFVITVVVDNAQVPGLGSGGRICGPAFRSIATQLIRYYNIEKPPSLEESILAMEGGLQ